MPALRLAAATGPLLLGLAIALLVFGARSASAPLDLGPLLEGTALTAGIALLVSLPIGLLSAIWIHELAPADERRLLAPLTTLLGALPGITVAVFASTTLLPFIERHLAPGGLAGAPHVARVAVGAVLGLLLVPFVASRVEDALDAVPSGVREAARALGGGELAVLTQVVLPSARPGLVATVLLATQRALGETIVVWLLLGGDGSVTAKIAELGLEAASGRREALGLACALALGLVAVTLALHGLAHRLFARVRSYA
jgi:phosphate transport system permease protein